ncbi:hypothetical protein C2I18_23585 [Paenibacillus sp. PK3_47]|uniref:hypothetical protein n=1 Tax=Paenibacillus sp. PK3_47 TaxID=2072642 RepID=UPI00201E6471|nr:hypothetical protein [Paenibacillus sp. PK3_47]UQZ36243.1 hypothetical protein C2I18_23585 [Paenibacillus sp. PK3_47]
MAILRDIVANNTYVEFLFLSCIPGEDEGCQLAFTYCRDNHVVYELAFGWTNLTIKNYIEVTSKFPLEALNDFILNNLYTSFEKHLYGLEWTGLEERNTYGIRFSGAHQDFSLKVTDAAVQQFGRELEAEWREGQQMTLNFA